MWAELKPDRFQHTVISEAGCSRSCIVSCLVQVWLFLNVVHLDGSHRHYCDRQKYSIVINGIKVSLIIVMCSVVGNALQSNQ